jgi:hypothetical protein
MTSQTIGLPGVNPQSLHGAVGMSNAEYEQMLDETFGPSPEERARTLGRAEAGGER